VEVTPAEEHVLRVLASLMGPTTVRGLVYGTEGDDTLRGPLRHPYKQTPGFTGPPLSEKDVRGILTDLHARGLVTRFETSPVKWWPTQDAMLAIRDAEVTRRNERQRAFRQATG
jgi:hypothetical protein